MRKQKYVLKRWKLELSSSRAGITMKIYALNYPIVSIEDGLSEDDWDGMENPNWKLETKFN